MTTDLDYSKLDPFEEGNLVYVRRMAAHELRDALPPNALDGLNEMDEVFAVHSDDGTRVAIVEGRDAAFAAARMHELQPLSVH